MTRVALYLIIVGALALGAAWFVDRPGEIVVTWPWLDHSWPGHGRIETPLWVLASALIVTVALLIILWNFLRLLVSSPFALSRFRLRRRGERAYQAISHGLVAIGAGDLAAAGKHTAEAKRLAPAEPLSLLLSAQTAQLSGDREAADHAFRAMASRSDTKALGLRGLHIEAQRRGDFAGAHTFAEEAARDNPSLGWAGKAVLEFRCLTGDWAGALALLEAQKPSVDKETYRRQRAVLLTARALTLEDTDRDSAKAYALEAVKLAPTLVPAAALAGRMLAEGDELRKASRVVTRAWEANPHPDLAQVLANLRFGDAARDRLKRIEILAKKVPDHIESALAMARAALDALEFTKARAALAPYLEAPTKRVALLMAELERAASNDEGRAREWIARALNAAPDPTWTTEGHTSDRWLPVSPSGRIDAFEWRVPVTGMIHAPVIEPEPAGDTQRYASLIAPSTTTAPPSRPHTEQTGIKPQPQAAPVIPLVHAPDDPGPDEQDESPTGEETDGWRKLFG